MKQLTDQQLKNIVAYRFWKEVYRLKDVTIGRSLTKGEYFALKMALTGFTDEYSIMSSGGIVVNHTLIPSKRSYIVASSNQSTGYHNSNYSSWILTTKQFASLYHKGLIAGHEGSEVYFRTTQKGRDKLNKYIKKCEKDVVLPWPEERYNNS